jgi:hypothetical protein
MSFIFLFLFFWKVLTLGVEVQEALDFEGLTLGFLEKVGVWVMRVRLFWSWDCINSAAVWGALGMGHA